MKIIDAEEQLMLPINKFGSYLIRESENTPGGYALSVRDRDQVQHYEIFQSNNQDFYVSAHSTFKTLQDLVIHHQQQADGLCVNLKKPCLIPDVSGKPIDKWQVDRSSIKFVRKLSPFTYCEVWEGVWNNATPVEVMTLTPNQNMTIENFLQSANLMKKLRHPKVVQLFALCSTEEPVLIITELMKHGSLLDYLRGKQKSLKLHQLIDMAVQVAAGMTYLEKKNVIHRELATWNILVGEGLSCKVANFQRAQIMDKFKSVYEGQEEERINIKWAAPEAALHRKFSIKSDVWSFGIVLYEIITYGRVPYPGMTNAQVNQQIQEGYRMPQPTGCPDKLYNIMLNCWREEPANRHTFETLHWQLEDFFY